ncbi:MAG: shikimate dehydrogenase [bacterium]|nr:shikimate dehydrogenase [bacterium]
MRTFLLFGHEIAYTASPAIQGAAIRELGLPHRYEVVDTTPEEFPGLAQQMRGMHGGANVTIPFKEAAFQLVDELSADAEEMRSVNTIVVEGDRLIGHNTDLPAIEDEFRALVPGGADRAVVLGAGGASRAVQTALARQGTEVTVAQRRDGSLARIAELLRGADVLVNCTPVGTGGGELPVDPALLREDLTVFDLIYRPTPTALVRAARSVGARARSGGPMLVGQAWRSLAHWLAADGITVGPEVAPPMLEALRLELGGTDDD